jgi:hypothetical protein
MYQLPFEIQCIIYQFDGTYHDIYKQVMNQITKRRYFYFCSFGHYLYYVYIPQDNIFHMTNSLDAPNFILSTYEIDVFQLEKVIKQYQLKEVDMLAFQFDIANNTGRPSLEYSHENFQVGN